MENIKTFIKFQKIFGAVNKKENNKKFIIF